MFRTLDCAPYFLWSLGWTPRYLWIGVALGGLTEASIPKSVRESFERRERESNISKR